MFRKHLQKTSFLNISTLPSYSSSIVCFLIVTSLYFRWIPIYSGITLAITLFLLIICAKSTSTVGNINKTALLFSCTIAPHIACIIGDSIKHGYQPIFILDILNIVTIILFILFTRTTNLDTFIPKLQRYQIIAGSLLCLVPSALFLLGIGSTVSEGLAIELAGKLSDFIKANIDYNILAFLLLLSLNSLVFSEYSKRPTVAVSTIISFGILYSSSRRAFLILVFLLPLIAIVRRNTPIQNIRNVIIGIGLAFLISSATITISYFYPFKNHISSKAVVQPLLRPLSFILTPSEYNKIYYKMIHNIKDHSKVSTEDIDFDNSLGELAIQPRKNRITATLSIIDRFTPQQQIFGHSFYLKELGKINNIPVDYPHNFLLTAFISTGLIGLILILSMVSLAFFGLHRFRRSWTLEAQIALLISVSFSLTSGFSYWSFLPLSLYSTFGIITFFRKPKELNVER